MHPLPVCVCLCVYLRFLRKDAGSLASRVLTRPNSCMTLSSCLRSSWPFSRNMNSWPLLPAEGATKHNVHLNFIQLQIQIQGTGVTSTFPLDIELEKTCCILHFKRTHVYIENGHISGSLLMWTLSEQEDFSKAALNTIHHCRLK